MLLESSEGNLTTDDLLALQTRLNELHQYGGHHKNLGGIKFRVTQSTKASDPNLPSTFFPGSGTDRFTFQIITWHRPTEDDIRRLIESAFVDYYLTSYDPVNGTGRVACLDCYALRESNVYQLTDPVNWRIEPEFEVAPSTDSGDYLPPQTDDGEVVYEMPVLADGSAIQEMKL